MSFKQLLDIPLDEFIAAERAAKRNDFRALNDVVFGPIRRRNVSISLDRYRRKGSTDGTLAESVSEMAALDDQTQNAFQDRISHPLGSSRLNHAASIAFVSPSLCTSSTADFVYKPWSNETRSNNAIQNSEHDSEAESIVTLHSIGLEPEGCFPIKNTKPPNSARKSRDKSRIPRISESRIPRFGPGASRTIPLTPSVSGLTDAFHGLNLRPNVIVKREAERSPTRRAVRKPFEESGYESGSEGPESCTPCSPLVEPLRTDTFACKKNSFAIKPRSFAFKESNPDFKNDSEDTDSGLGSPLETGKPLLPPSGNFTFRHPKKIHLETSSVETPSKRNQFKKYDVSPSKYAEAIGEASKQFNRIPTSRNAVDAWLNEHTPKPAFVRESAPSPSPPPASECSVQERKQLCPSLFPSPLQFDAGDNGEIMKKEPYRAKRRISKISESNLSPTARNIERQNSMVVNIADSVISDGSFFDTRCRSNSVETGVSESVSASPSEVFDARMQSFCIQTAIDFDPAELEEDITSPSIIDDASRLYQVAFFALQAEATEDKDWETISDVSTGYLGLHMEPQQNTFFWDITERLERRDSMKGDQHNQMLLMKFLQLARELDDKMREKKEEETDKLLDSLLETYRFIGEHYCRMRGHHVSTISTADSESCGEYDGWQAKDYHEWAMNKSKFKLPETNCKVAGGYQSV